MFVDGEGAWLGLMATVEAFRGRGAQKALLHRRLRDAQAAGCSWATADTAQPTPTKPNPSLHNMQAVGFTISYERADYVL
jgi:GNAT superfamily N-acetyltransferase